MKHNRYLPIYYRCQPMTEDGKIVGDAKYCATMIGVENHIRDNGVKFGIVETSQKDDNGIFQRVEGKAKAIYHGIVGLREG